MSEEEPPAEATTKNSPVSVQARIQRYQTTQKTEEEGPTHSPQLTPPKPPARRRKFLPMEPPKQPYRKASESPDIPTKKLGSTDLMLLPPSPASSSFSHPKPVQRSQTVKPRATPPRPPPPSTKPSIKIDKKPLSEEGRGTSPATSPSTRRSHSPLSTSPKANKHLFELPKVQSRPPPSVPSVPQPSPDPPSTGTSEERRLKKRSSLSDSTEEEKKVAPPTPTSASINSRGSFFGKFKTQNSFSPIAQPPSLTFENSIELEESFDVIPEVSNTNIVDMAERMKERDAKLHDANIYEVVQAVAREIPHIASSKDLPPHIPNFPSGKREHVVHELYTTEYSYVKQLEVIVEVYKPQLGAVLEDTSNSIFANVDDILAFNRGFLALLHTRLVRWSDTQCIGDMFLGMFNQTHKSMYAIYCSNYDNAEQIFLKLKKKKELEVTLQACQSDSRVMPGVTLPMFLITPVQRIPRYILLLKDIIKATSEHHPDYDQLKQAEQKMGELADFINVQIQESQTRKTLEHLKTKVQGLSDLELPNRSLVKEGPVFLQNVKKPYQCILFNDMLVFALGDSRQSTVQLQIPLEALWVEDLEDRDPQTHSEDAIELYTPQRPYTMYVQTNSEKKLWLPKLRETIYHHLINNSKCIRNDSLDSTTRYASFLYVTQQTYNGHFTDALRNGKGTMSWPNHSVFIGDWIDDERSGEGEFKYNTGETYNGRWREDKQNGIGELQYYTGDMYRGSWKDGLRHGKGKIVYSNGDVFEGIFHSGHIEGRGKLTCQHNGVNFEGDFKNSLRHGNGTLTTIQGNKYTGEFNYNQMHGQGKMVFYNGDVYDGNWKNGMRQGSGKFMSKLEGHYEGSWDRDLKHGKGTMKYKNGNVYEGFWEYNKWHGKGTLTLSTGELYVGEFEHGLMSGNGEMEYKKNMKYKGEWLNNLRHGHGIMIYEDGSEYDGEWNMGLRHGQGAWKRKDGIFYSGGWEYDQPNGEGELEHEQTKYRYKGKWVNGKREGRGLETTDHWNYSGGFRNDMKHGAGEERTILGTVFKGHWERGRKHGSGQRKIAYGLTEDQIWKSGQLTNDPQRMTAVELPSIPRADLQI